MGGKKLLLKADTDSSWFLFLTFNLISKWALDVSNKRSKYRRHTEQHAVTDGRMQQTSQEYQPNMASNVEIKLGITFPSKAALVNPVGGK